MKAGRSLQDLAAELERQHRSKKDFMADTRRLALKPLASGTDNPHEHVMLEGVNGGSRFVPLPIPNSPPRWASPSRTTTACSWPNRTCSATTSTAGWRNSRLHPEHVQSVERHVILPSD
jgi:hypothetical protein